MKESGINVKIFDSYSTRSMRTVKYKMSGLSFKEIVKLARWSNKKNSRFYDRPIKELLNYLFR